VERHNPDFQVTTTEIEDLQELKAELLSKKRAKKAAKKAAQIGTSAASNDDTTDDSSVVESVSSTTSSNPGFRKKTRTGADGPSGDPSVPFTFGTSPKLTFDDHEPHTNRPDDQDDSCVENIHTHLPAEILESANSMTIQDEDVLVDGEQFMMDIANDPILQANLGLSDDINNNSFKVDRKG
jgi:hypothetical protein